MRKQNRNNRICTNEESGKTDFIIDPLLPIGKENAITTQELMRISGCGSSRELRQRIALERERGAIICSGSGRGYTSKGWYVGKTKMKDWKASVRTWEKNQRQKNKKSKDDEGLEGWLNA